MFKYEILYIFLVALRIITIIAFNLIGLAVLIKIFPAVFDFLFRSGM